MELICGKNFSNISSSKISRISKDENENNIEEEIKFKKCEGHQRKVSVKNLGIYRNDEGEYKTDCLVGILPIVYEDGENYRYHKEGYYWCIEPRWGDAVSMLETVLRSNDIVDEKCSKLFQPEVKKWNEWKNVNIKEKDSDFLYGVVSDFSKIDISDESSGKFGPRLVSNIQNVFEIYNYLQQLEIICKRVIKQQSLPCEENLSCRIRGRVLVNKQIKYNLSKGRMDRNYCSYNKMSIDNLENRILKYALHICKKWCSERNGFLADKITYCENALKSVKLVKIKNADFHAVKTNGAFKEYKKGMELAKNIINNMEIKFSANEEEGSSVKTRKVTPFFIRMDLLFELYCRALIRNAIEKSDDITMEEYSKNTKQLFDYSEDDFKPQGFQENHIADILLKKKDKYTHVIDAKYSMLAEGYSNRNRGNTHQILSYMLLFDTEYAGFIYPIFDKIIAFSKKVENRKKGISYSTEKENTKNENSLQEKKKEFMWDDFGEPVTFGFYGYSVVTDVKTNKEFFWISNDIKLEISKEKDDEIYLKYTKVTEKEQKNEPECYIYVDVNYKKIYLHKYMEKKKFNIKDRKRIGFSIGISDTQDEDGLIKQIGEFI